jgi:hypothetical protein
MWGVNGLTFRRNDRPRVRPVELHRGIADLAPHICGGGSASPAQLVAWKIMGLASNVVKLPIGVTCGGSMILPGPRMPRTFPALMSPAKAPLQDRYCQQNTLHPFFSRQIGHCTAGLNLFTTAHINEGKPAHRPISV